MSLTNASHPTARGGFWGSSMRANYRHPINKPTDSEISWQSAMWPVIACMFAVMMQNTGRVLELSPELGTVLRASPLCCLADILMTLIEFSCLLCAGCPISKAARYIWYSRYAQINYKVKRSRFESAWDDVREWANSPEARLSLPQDEGPASSAASVQPQLSSTDPASGFGTGIETDDTERARPFAEHGICTEDNHENSYGSPCAICFSRVESEALSATASPISAAQKPFASIEDFSSLRYYTSKQDALNYTWIHIAYFPGSEIDRTWRLSICAFIFGALPQIIKIASMHGIPWTQAFVSAYTLSFIVPEFFRLIARKAGATNLAHSPLSPTVEWVLMIMKLFLGVVSIFISLMYYYWYICVAISVAFQGQLLHPIVISLAFTMGFFTSRLLIWISTRFGHMWTFDVRIVRPDCFDTISKRVATVGCACSSTFNDVFALDTSPIPLSLPVNYVLFIPLSLGFSTLLYHSLPLEAIMLLLKVVVQLGILSYFFVTSLITFWILFFVHRALFVGTLSRIPRRLTGMEGTMSEFLCGYFIFVAVVGMFCGYAYDGWEPEGTYKPDWAENLG